MRTYFLGSNRACGALRQMLGAGGAALAYESGHIRMPVTTLDAATDNPDVAQRTIVELTEPLIAACVRDTRPKRGRPFRPSGSFR